MDLINKLHPNCITANLGLDARWAGNEGGYAREAEWSAQAYKPAAYMQPTMKNMDLNQHLQTLEADKY